MKKNKSLLALSIPVFVVVVALVWMLVNESKKNPDVYVGTLEAPTVDVSSEIPGRIDTLFVDLGDHVNKGQLLATLEANIMDAKLAQAQGMKEATKALLMKVEKGARKELIDAARNQYLMAKVNLSLLIKRTTDSGFCMPTVSCRNRRWMKWNLNTQPPKIRWKRPVQIIKWLKTVPRKRSWGL